MTAALPQSAFEQRLFRRQLGEIAALDRTLRAEPGNSDVRITVQIVTGRPRIAGSCTLGAHSLATLLEARRQLLQARLDTAPSAPPCDTEA